MGITEQGEARWKVFKYSRAILKLMEIAIPIICLPLLITYDSTSYVHYKNSTEWFNITLKFPFDFENGKGFYITNDTIPTGSEFGSSHKLTTLVFAGSLCFAFVMAAFILLIYVCNHGNPSMDSTARADGALSLIVSITLLVISGLWTYHIVTLENNVNVEIESAYSNFLKEECIIQHHCIKSVSDFMQLYIVAGVSLFAVILWILSTVEGTRYGMTSVLFFRQDVTGILEMNPDIGDLSARA